MPWVSPQLSPEGSLGWPENKIIRGLGRKAPLPRARGSVFLNPVAVVANALGAPRPCALVDGHEALVPVLVPESIGKRARMG